MTETLRPWSELDESELVTRAQQRDEAAFAELMRRNTSPSLRLAISVLKDALEQHPGDDLVRSRLADIREIRPELRVVPPAGA